MLKVKKDRLTSSKMDLSLAQSSFTVHFVVATLVWILCIFSPATVSAQGGQISCSVSQVKLQGSTSLKCHFPENVQDTRRDFTIYYYRNKGSPDAVLDCWWLSGNVDCFIAPGYKFDKRISREISLEIPVVSGSQIGTYACQLASYGPDSISTCNLKPLLDGKSACEVISVQPDTDTSLSCFFPKDLNESKLGFTVYHYLTRGDAAAVLSCEWRADRLNCDVSKFNFDNKVSDRLTLKIPKASQAQEGNYSCQTKGPEYLLYNNCSFYLQRAKPKASCNISSVKENEPAALTCIFSSDISVTKDNFEVVRLGGKGPNVANCTWTNGKFECFTATGFNINKTVTDRVIIRLPQATPDHTGQYACRLQGSDKGDFTPCAFMVTAADPDDNSSAGVAAAVVISLLVVIAAIVIILFVLWRKGKITYKLPPFLQRFFKQEEEQGSPESEKMMPKKNIQKKKDETTENLLNYLSNDFWKMYPDSETKSYLVPPMYFNRNTYIDGNIGGQHVYLTQPPNEKTAKHDEAMARVLHSLRLLTEQEDKKQDNVMFVISQFNYDDYLASPGQDFLSHKLPMPAHLRSQNKHFGDFDILIVHRLHGVLVGVVNACGDHPEEATDAVIVEELRESCEQLNNAHRMLNHLLVDDQYEGDIHKLLIFPHLSHNRLGRVLQGYDDMAKDLAECLGISESPDLRKECLCAEHLAGIDELKNFLSHRLMRSKCETTVSQYVTILSRFCGPSTHWTLKIPGGPQKAVVSTAFKHWVSMTGDLFRAPVLQPEQWEVLNDHSPRVFLTGPPASGKTRMLVLTGIRWMSKGHTVHVVSTCKESRAATQMIHAELSRVLQEKQLPGAVSSVFFENENTTERVKQMTGKAADGSLYIIADEPESYEKQSNFKAFVDSLQKKVPELYLWAASYFSINALECCKTQAFTKSLTCPPSILLQEDVTKVVSECSITGWRPDMRTTTPTEGPPIKFVNHSDKGHKGDHPGVCEQCATEVDRFLRTLFICKKVDCSSVTDGSSHLHYKDVLVLFENTSDPTNTRMCKMLATAGKKVKVLDIANPVTSAITATNDEILATKGKQMLGIKKKVVIYVEEKPTPKNPRKSMPSQWKRLRGLTSSTSQLIWVKTKLK